LKRAQRKPRGAKEKSKKTILLGPKAPELQENVLKRVTVDFQYWGFKSAVYQKWRSSPKILRQLEKRLKELQTAGHGDAKSNEEKLRYVRIAIQNLPKAQK